MIARSRVPDDVALRWFEREGQLAAKLNHPNIVTVYDMGTIDERPYIAMELLEGTTLLEEMHDRPPMPMADLMAHFKQITAAVQYAHEQGIIHRDIKADNIMITAESRVKLMDFGLARALEAPSRTVLVAGTAEYMSPEQIVGEDVDERTDIYALGVLLFRLVAGRFPYQEGNVLQQHRESPIPDPRRFNPSVSAGFCAVIRRAMAKRKRDRYGTPAELYAAMKLALSAAHPRFEATVHAMPMVRGPARAPTPPVRGTGTEPGLPRFGPRR